MFPSPAPTLDRLIILSTVLQHAMIGLDNLLDSLPLSNVDVTVIVTVTFTNDIIVNMWPLLPLGNRDIRNLHGKMILNESGSPFILGGRESIHCPSL
jgi:hypothetical protein